MSAPFESEYFDTLDELIQAKDDAFLPTDDRRKRLKLVRQFTNMISLFSEEEKEKMNRTELTNHGLTYRDMVQNETRLVSLVTGTNALLDLVVDTDNPEQDVVTSQRISETINRYAIHRKGRFANFWKKVCGEIIIAGGAPVVMPEKYGWLPKLSIGMFFPKETSLDAEEVPYAFDPAELSIDDLKELSASVKGDKGNRIDKSAVDALIKSIKDNVKGNGTGTTSTVHIENNESVRTTDHESRSVTISAWWYFEVKFNDAGESYVSATLFVDNITGISFTDKKKSEVQRVIAYVDKAYVCASDWLHMACIDSEIGGVKTVDTLRGLAELVYPSGMDMEELFNLTIEGDKIRARPKFTLTNEADADDVARLNVMEDLYFPTGVEEMAFKGSSNSLQTPLSILSQNASGLSSSSVSNGPGGGELRQQALERQQNNSMVQDARITEAYNHLEAILENVVWRILAGPTKPGTSGYQEIRFIRARLEAYGIDYKKLAEREYGMFKYIRVRVRRNVGNGDRVQQLETSDWLMENVQSFEPQARPAVIHRAVVLRTQDPDLADSLVKIPKSIINAQKVTAENERDTIAARAPLGQVLPVMPDDIHQDHIPVHLLDMQGLIARHSVRPWDKLDVLTFAGMTEHVGEHIKILLSNQDTNGEGKVYVQNFQQIAQAAQAITKEIEEAEGSEMTQLTPKEQADLQLKWKQYELEAAKFGVKVEETRKLWENRESRAALSQRQQYTNEINNDRRLKLDAAKTKAQVDSANNKTKNSAKPKSKKA